VSPDSIDLREMLSLPQTIGFDVTPFTTGIDTTTNKMPQIKTDLVFAPPAPLESRTPLVN
jgi:hypothetical protein